MSLVIFTYSTALTVPYSLTLPAETMGLGEFLALMVTMVIAIRMIRGDWPFGNW